MKVYLGGAITSSAKYAEFMQIVGEIGCDLMDRGFIPVCPVSRQARDTAALAGECDVALTVGSLIKDEEEAIGRAGIPVYRNIRSLATLKSVRVVGLSGYARSGKDTVATYLRRRNIVSVALADSLRDVLRNVNPWIHIDMSYWDMEKAVGCLAANLIACSLRPNRALRAALMPWRSLNAYVPYRELIWRVGYETAKNLPAVREIIQKYGTEGGRNIHGDNCWVRLAKRKAIKIMSGGTGVVFTDVRFQNEVDMVHDLGGKVWRIVRPGCGPVNNHTSDTSLEGDVGLFNYAGIGHLYSLVDRLCDGESS